MLRKIVALGLAGLFLAMTFVVAENSVEPYNPIVDVNRDGTVDILDLVEVGQAYGSNFTLPTHPNQTLVYVYQVEKYPAEVQNARVAIVDPNDNYQVVQVEYTNSTGFANFTLNSHSNYTALAWNNTTYSYVDFTTNESGKASVVIQLGYPHLPHSWVVLTVINATSGALIHENLDLLLLELEYNSDTSEWAVINSAISPVSLGVSVLKPYSWILETGHWVAMAYRAGVVLSEAGFSPNENGSAFVVIYV